MLRPTLLATVLILALAPAGHAREKAGRALPVVVQDDATLIAEKEEHVRAAMHELRGLGVDWVRLTASWSALTRDPESPTRPGFDATDPGAYLQPKWEALDQAVVLAREAGLKVMIDIGFWAPRWATVDGGPRPRTYINPQEFRAFAVAVVRRYGGGFTVPTVSGGGDDPAPPSGGDDWHGKILGSEEEEPEQDDPPPARRPGPLPKVSTFLLWNEPNHPAFLMPQWRTTASGKTIPVSPHLYRGMVEAAYPAIKAVRGDARVLIGNTSSMGGGDGKGAVAPLRFLRALACVDRHLRPVKTGECGRFTRVPGDGWAQHPYALDVLPSQRSTGNARDDVRIADLPRLAKLLDRLVKMRRLDPALRSIYLTEFGYETQPIKGRPRLSEGIHARYLTWSEYVASRVPAVKMFGQFLLRDVPPASAARTGSPRRPNGQFSSGLQHADGSFKLAMRSFVAGLYVERLSRHRVLLWGRLRLGANGRTMRVQRQVARRKWETVLTSVTPRGRAYVDFAVPGMGTFTRYAKVAIDTRYRLLYHDGRSWVTGLPVPAVDERPVS
jgi:hypothetical protein